MTMQKKNILNNFKDVLGQYCAINQFIELSKRCFVLDHEKDMATRENFIALATRNSVTLTDYNAENMVNAISRSYIVNVNLCFETFLKDACTQVRKYGRETYQDKVQEQSWLKCAANNIIQDKLPADKQAIYDLCEYYRLIRNSAVHDLCEVDDHIKEYKKLQKYDFKVEANFSKLLAPNEYDNISFDDFVMFARSCVELATYLFNHISYDYEKIVLDAANPQKADWKKYTKERREKAILNYINTLFRIDDTLDAEIAYLADIVMAQ